MGGKGAWGNRNIRDNHTRKTKRALMNVHGQANDKNKDYSINGHCMVTDICIHYLVSGFKQFRGVR